MDVFQMLKYQYIHFIFFFLTFKIYSPCSPASVWIGYSLGLHCTPHTRPSLIYLFIILGGGILAPISWTICFLVWFTPLLY